MNKKKNIIVAVCSLIGLTAATISVINKIIFTVATAEKLLEKKQTDIFHWRFGDIHYTKSGSGKPLLLIHELNPACSSYEWKSVLSKLEESHTVYAIDLLGCGKSEKQNFTYTNFLYVELINDFIKTVIGKRTDVFASNHSCSLVLHACNYNSDYFDKLILINPEPILEAGQTPGRKSKLAKFIVETPVIGTLLYNILYRKNNLAKTLLLTGYYDIFSVSRQDISILHEASHLGGSKAKYLHASIKGNFTKLPVSNAVKNINNSILIVGCDSIQGIRSSLSDYRELNPSIETVVMKETALLPHLEKPEEFLEAIDPYL